MDATTVKYELTKRHTDTQTHRHTYTQTDRQTDRHLQKSYVEGPVQNNEKTKIENVVWILSVMRIGPN